MTTYTASQIYDNAHAGPGTSSLNVAWQAGVEQKDLQARIEDALAKLNSNWGHVWKGAASDAAQSGIVPMLRSARDAHDALYVWHDCGDRQSESFTRLKNTVIKVPENAPTSNFMNDLAWWETDKDKEIKTDQNDRQTNVVAYESYSQASTSNSFDLPTQYGNPLNDNSSVSITQAAPVVMPISNPVGKPPANVDGGHPGTTTEHHEQTHVASSGGPSASALHDKSGTPTQTTNHGGSIAPVVAGSVVGNPGTTGEVSTGNINTGSTAAAGVSVATPSIPTADAFQWPTAADNQRATAGYAQNGNFAGVNYGNSYDEHGNLISSRGISAGGENAGRYASPLAQGKTLGTMKFPTGESAVRGQGISGPASAQNGQQPQMPGMGNGAKGKSDRNHKRKYILEEELAVGEIQKTAPRVLGVPEEDEKK
jgi:hypothetical protein